MKHFFSFILFLSFSVLFAQQGRIDSLQNVIKSYKKDDTIKVNWLLDLSREFTSTGSYEKANQIAGESATLLKKLLKENNGESMEIKAKLALTAKSIGINYYFLGSYDKALEYFNVSSKVFEEMGDEKGVASINNNMGEVYRLKGNYDLALEYYFKALDLLEKFGEDLKMAATYNNIGMIHYYKKDYEKSLEFYLMAISKYEQKNRENPDDNGIKVWMGNSYTNIGNIHKDNGGYDKALEYYLKALKIREQIGDKKGIADSYIGLGLIHVEKARTANANAVVNDYKKALDFYFKALKIKEEIGDKQGLAMAYGDIGIVFLNQNEISKSKQYLLKSLQFAKDIQSKPILQQNYLNLSQSDSALGNFKNAYEYYKLYTEIKDSIFNAETSEKTAELQTRYESEKKEKEIELLKKDGEIQFVDLKRQKVLSYSVIVGLILMITIAIVIFRSLWVTRKQKHIIEIAKDQISEQKKKVDEHQKEIIDSINYAKRIQFALLAHTDLLKNNLPQHFVLFKPKDIVSGDFYWATQKENRFYLAVCDSTGHGVPGAFMSLLNISFLNEAINEKGIIKPNEVLNHVRMRLIENISQDGIQDGLPSEMNMQDGMDAILCKWEMDGAGPLVGKQKIEYAAANNAPLLFQDGKITELPYDKMPVGKGDKKDSFTLHNLELSTTDDRLPTSFYLFTDGYADQFGGPKGKKFKYKQLEEKLGSILNLPMEEQKNSLEKIFTEWKGNLEQVDDICVIGMRV